MTLAELQRLVAKGESQHLEFKHKIQFPEKVAKEIVAFCNTRGGILLIGVDDNKQLFGLKNVEEEVFTLSLIKTKYIRFPVEWDLEIIKISEKKSVIKLDIKEAIQKPNYALDAPGQRFGTAYVRHEDKSIQASDTMIQFLKLSSKSGMQAFTLGEVEKKILSYIDTQGSSTLLQISNQILTSKEVIQKAILQMLIHRVLQITPRENGEDLFSTCV